MKKISFGVLSLISVIFLFWLIHTKIVKSEPGSNLILTVRTDKETYILGEKINLQFEIKDRNDKTFTLRGLPTVEVGFMQVWIAAASNRNFKEYKGANWGRYDSSKPWTGKSFESQAEILWNGKPPESWKNESFGKDLMNTDYPFMEGGIYLIKAAATIVDENAKSDEDKIVIESEPIRIVVDNPVDDDLVVWNKIKNNANLGLFMQHGRFTTTKPEEMQKLFEQVEKLIAKYPNSILVQQLKQGREKYLEVQEMIRQTQEEIKQNNEKKP